MFNIFRKYKNEISIYFVFFSPLVGMAWVSYFYMLAYSLLHKSVRKDRKVLYGIGVFFFCICAAVKYVQMQNFSSWFALIRFFLGWGIVYIYLNKHPLNININKLIIIYSIEVILEFLLINFVISPTVLLNYPDVDGVGNIGPFTRVYSVGSNSSISGVIMCMLLSYRASLEKYGVEIQSISVELFSTIAMLLFASGTAFYLFFIYLLFRLNLLRIRYAVLLCITLFLFYFVVSKLTFNEDSILSHASWNYLSFIGEYKQFQIDTLLCEYRTRSLFWGYHYPNGELPLTWGDFALLEYYISFGYIGILLLFGISIANMNKCNIIPVAIGILGSFHYGGIFATAGQLVFICALLLNKAAVESYQKNIK